MFGQAQGPVPYVVAFRLSSAHPICPFCLRHPSPYLRFPIYGHPQLPLAFHPRNPRHPFNPRSVFGVWARFVYSPGRLLAAIRASNFANALPESIASAAIRMPSRKSHALSPATMAAAALSNAMSRAGPSAPFKTDRVIAALLSASPPLSASARASPSPKSPGENAISRYGPRP